MPGTCCSSLLSLLHPPLPLLYCLLSSPHPLSLLKRNHFSYHHLLLSSLSLHNFPPGKKPGLVGKKREERKLFL
ncbi:hypothetical protein COCNU_07G006390 [Cocos nucifera]|uniref:Uncharacterized protein n=1 Tax=Cocos nucifera TaxID=13894 RepID=A0A8K0IFI7_COCNU|nr:hypothetical protein COCNU_07G006390 [Cocos nucifera]